MHVSVRALTMHARLLIRSAYSLKPKRAGGTSGCLGGWDTSYVEQTRRSQTQGVVQQPPGPPTTLPSGKHRMSLTTPHDHKRALC